MIFGKRVVFNHQTKTKMFFSKTITIVITDKNGKFQIFLWFLTVSYHSTRAAIKRVQNEQTNKNVTRDGTRDETC